MTGHRHHRSHRPCPAAGHGRHPRQPGRRRRARLAALGRPARPGRRRRRKGRPRTAGLRLDGAAAAGPAHGAEPRRQRPACSPGRPPTPRGVVAIPGASEFLASLHGLPHALVTSADVPLSTARMAAAGLTQPDVRVTRRVGRRQQARPRGLPQGRRRAGHRPRRLHRLRGLRRRHHGRARRRDAGRGRRPAAGVHGPDVVVEDLTRVRVEAGATGRCGCTSADGRCGPGTAVTPWRNVTSGGP